MIKSLPIEIRNATNADLNFILDSWMRSFYERGNWAYPKEAYSSNQRNKTLRILAEGAKYDGVRLAVNTADHDQIFGYVVGWGNALHYLYVKAPFRRFGVAKMLHNEGFSRYTHHTNQSIFITKNMEFEDNWKCNFNIKDPNDM